MKKHRDLFWLVETILILILGTVLYCNILNSEPEKTRTKVNNIFSEYDLPLPEKWELVVSDETTAGPQGKNIEYYELKVEADDELLNSLNDEKNNEINNFFKDIVQMANDGGGNGGFKNRTVLNPGDFEKVSKIKYLEPGLGRRVFVWFSEEKGTICLLRYEG